MIEIDSPKYEKGAGLFHNLLIVVGALDYIEKHPFNSLSVDYKDQGRFFEKEKGSNWWNYYFKPINIGSMKGKLKCLTDAEKAHFGNSSLYFMNRKRACYLISKYIRLKTNLIAEIKAFQKKHFYGFYMIGVHYRGTDKYKEAQKVSYETLLKKVTCCLDSNRSKNPKVFLATDDIEAKKFLEKHLGSNIITQNILYSSGTVGVHYRYKGYLLGKCAVMDAYLLSKCHQLIRTSSNLSAVSAYLNPSLLVTNLNAIFTEHLTPKEINKLNELNRVN